MRVQFLDFWDWDPKKDPVFGKTLSKYFDIEYVDRDPDLVIFSVFGNAHKKFPRDMKVFYSAENYKKFQYAALDSSNDPDIVWKHAKFVISHFRYESENSFVMPNYVRKYGFEYIQKLYDLPLQNFEERKFATFIQGNCSNNFRNNFVKELSKYKRVDCPGPCLNNMTHRVRGGEDKIEFCKNYKFVMAFENSSTPGYNTEKIFEPFMSSSIPIYWGDEEISHIFNDESFVNFHEYGSVEKTIERIIELDSNAKEYERVLNSKRISNSSPFSEESFIKFSKKFMQ